ncbi:MAG: hypothetical protein ACREXT_17105, partial [Gammaproteobacteria bacterium]
MKSASRHNRIATVFLLAAFASCAAVADQKSRGKDKHWKADESEHPSHTRSRGDHDDRYYQRDDDDDDDDDRHDDHDHDYRGGDYHGGRYFSDQHRIIVHNYYLDEFNHGRCPPGLRKKHNGCMPPGLAKQWQIGRRLARDVIYYDLP